MPQFGLRGWLYGLGESGPVRAGREVVVLTFRGSRSDLEMVTARRFEAALLLIFLAARVVHLGQAGVDLALAGRVYSHGSLAWAWGAACLIESALFAAASLPVRRLGRTALLGDALFGLAGLGVMSVATSSTLGRAGSLNWMLPYTVATAAGIGLVAMGDLVGTPVPGEDDQEPDAGLLKRLWAPGIVVALGGAYVASAYLPHRLADEHVAQIWGNAANYPVFFAAAFGAAVLLGRALTLVSVQNAEVSRAAAQLAHEAEWRAVAVDVFGPVIDLLDRVAELDDGEISAQLRDEAGRLICLIDAIRPFDSNLSASPVPSGARGPRAA